MISEHEYSVVIAGERLPITSGTVTLDEGWAPYGQARVEIPLPPADKLRDLDPRVAGRAMVTMSARYGSAYRVAQMTERYAGLPMSAITADLVGKSHREITAELSEPFSSSGHRDTSFRRLDLGVTERDIDRKRGVLILSLATDEALLQDDMPTAPLTPGQWTVRAAVALALARIGAVLQPGAADGTVSGQAAVWEVGTTGWDYVQSLVNAAGLRLWCDERRRWWLTAPLGPETAPGVYTAVVGESVDFLEKLSRDEWATGVIVTYEWDTSAGRQTQHDVAGGGTRVVQIRVPRPWPGNGAAAAILQRMRARGSLITSTQVSTYEVTPGWVMRAPSTDTAHQAGLVSSVVWNLDTDVVDVSSRDLSDTPARSWIMQPDGYRWTDVPVGVKWTTYTTPSGV